MSENAYPWMAALGAAFRQQLKNPIQEDPPLLRDIYAQAGTFNNAPGPAANDLLAAALALTVYVWIRAIYHTNAPVFSHFCAKRSQNKKGSFSDPYQAVTLATTAFQETSAFFWMPLLLCQMNSPLTLSKYLVASNLV